jgi:ornithine cyclodeaminase
MGTAVDVLEAAFEEVSSTGAPLRSHISTPDGDLLLMPATAGAGTGVKLVSVTPSNPGRGLPLIHAVYVLFSPRTMEPLAVIDGSALTAIRTAAVSGVATRHLAMPEASRLVIFGAVVQAASHLEAMCEVLPISEVRVVSRTRDRA